MSSTVSSTLATLGSSTPSVRSTFATAGPAYNTATQASENFTECKVPLTTANLAKYTSPTATRAYALNGPAKVEKLHEAARSLRFELPAQVDREILQGYKQPTCMRRFIEESQEYHVRGVPPMEWQTLTEHDPLAAEIEAEIAAIIMREQARVGGRRTEGELA